MVHLHRSMPRSWKVKTRYGKMEGGGGGAVWTHPLLHRSGRLLVVHGVESFYGNAPQFVFTEIAGFQTSSRPVLPKYARRHRSIGLLQTRKCLRMLLSWHLFSRRAGHETFAKENRRVFVGKGYRRTSL